jgi:hypothetical protein
VRPCSNYSELVKRNTLISDSEKELRASTGAPPSLKKNDYFFQSSAGTPIAIGKNFTKATEEKFGKGLCFAIWRKIVETTARKVGFEGALLRRIAGSLLHSFSTAEEFYNQPDPFEETNKETKAYDKLVEIHVKVPQLGDPYTDIEEEEEEKIDEEKEKEDQFEEKEGQFEEMDIFGDQVEEIDIYGDSPTDGDQDH